MKISPRVDKIAIKDAKLRTFITADDRRDDLVAHIYDITYGTVRETDNLVMIDDSIVRGTTLKQSILRILDRLHPKKIIILSSISNPDDCFQYKEMSRNINIISTKKLISKIIKKRLYFIFFSSEFVYDGSRGNYSESYPAKPINIYGKQKFLIEKFINSKTKNCAIFRIGKTYGDELSDQSFVASFFNSLIKGKRVFNIAADQKLSPLYVKDLIKIIKIFLKK